MLPSILLARSSAIAGRTVGHSVAMISLSTSSRALTARLAVAATCNSLHARTFLSVARPAIAATTFRSDIVTPSMFQMRLMSDKTVKTPSMGDSITEGTLTQWHKKVGDYVSRDEQVATIETDKIDIQVNSPDSGKITELCSNEGDTVAVGGNLFKLELGEVPAGAAAPSTPEPPKAPAAAPKAAVSAPAPPPKAPAFSPATPPKAAVNTPAPSKAASPAAAPIAATDDFPGYAPGVRTERRVKVNRMRSRIAERLKESQNTAASLTQFNEIDMSSLMELRSKYKDQVLEKHGVKFGFMGAFVKACVQALQAVPAVNARMENDEIVYNDFVDVSIAVATPKGLVTPVVRNCESLSMVQVEQSIAGLGKKARDGLLSLEDMVGGTFTISNGGVFGSMMGTPIINQPQSAIFGMHAVKDRAVVVNGQVVVRPMMYIALTYDHRLIDGREATTFLVKVKEAIEDPRRLLLDV
ncbi:hypothetical protein QVD99_005458 [Batrachochytrium dendrobatidis]|nr:hypothetical protein O5D80_004206 [Batrachochytrium dendrobatidis]KAK5668437.1 hypothetical protein QVD99_005458 [Batrachochytrium dendrobatidis]